MTTTFFGVDQGCICNNQLHLSCHPTTGYSSELMDLHWPCGCTSQSSILYSPHCFKKTKKQFR